MRRFGVPLCLSAALVLSAAPAHAAQAVTPLIPTVTDECGTGSDRVSVPQVPGVRYLVTLDGESIELAAGDWAGIAFLTEEFADLDEDPPRLSATIRAVAEEGFDLAGGTTTSFPISFSFEPCGTTNTPVTARAECEAVTFTNPAGNPEALVLFETGEEEDIDELSLAPGASARVPVASSALSWFAVDAGLFDEEDLPEEYSAQERLLGDESPLDLGSWDSSDTAPPSAARDAEVEVPDHVATGEDRELFAEIGIWWDLMVAADLGGGDVAVEQDCAATTPADDAGAPPAAPGSLPAPESPAAPVVPAIVATDGGGATDRGLLPAGLLGGLVAAAALLILRRRRERG